MSYTSPAYFVLAAVLFAFYYVIPKRYRYLDLLAGSAMFYYLVSGGNLLLIGFFLLTVLFAFVMGIMIEQNGKQRTFLHIAGWTVLLAPLLVNRTRDFLLHGAWNSWILPVGISFYTMQLCAYLSDIAHGKIKAQRSFLRFLLFASFFPQIIQGPIPRYEQLAAQLEEGHDFDERTAEKGFCLILWGAFLKFMIADHAAVVVNAVFDHYAEYTGRYVWLAAVLYSIQLYADFLSCTTISQGVSLLFGIRLSGNFDHPYFSVSIRDFWRRWHISLSSWLRDYVYIPLGGSRKGNIRKYANLCLTFLVSGLWHGGAVQYLAWGLYHAFLQIMGSLVPKGITAKVPRVLQIIKTDLLVMAGWIIFRAQGLRASLTMLKGLFQRSYSLNWTMLGTDGYDMTVLLISVIILFAVSFLQGKESISDRLLRQNIVIRWTACISLIFVIVIFGAYGSGFNASDFIYGGF
ncbi:MAG: hypothetical protein K6F23_09065 [Solobacterium sp.]|nr:hypothetical protein [Solobacterium sp.]